MPKHASSTPGNPKPKNKPRSLTPTELDLFKKHAKLHSKAHINSMKAFMKAGKGCFADAHRHAMKTVGK